MVTTKGMEPMTYSTKKISKKDEELIINSFTRNFEERLNELDIENGIINFQSFVELLYAIGCTNEQNHEKQPSKIKLLWTTLMEDNESIESDKLFNTLCNILLIPIPDVKRGNKLHKEFYEVYATYSSTGRGRRVTRPTPSTFSQEYSFRPQLCEKSKVLAAEKPNYGNIINNNRFTKDCI